MTSLESRVGGEGTDAEGLLGCSDLSLKHKGQKSRGLPKIIKLGKPYRNYSTIYTKKVEGPVQCLKSSRKPTTSIDKKGKHND